MATDAFRRLAGAIKTKNFVPLYQTMAPTFRAGVPLRRIVDEFRTFTDNQVDLTTADPKLLVVTPPPYLDEHGVLIVKGFETTPAQPWYFEFGFLKEGQGWSLVKLSLSATLLPAHE